MKRNLAAKWYLDLPVRYKILLWFVPLLVATIASTGAYAYWAAAEEIVNKMSAEQAATARQAVSHLDYIAQDALDISNYLYLTPEIQTLLSSDTENEKRSTSRNVIDSINRLMVTRPYFQFLTIYSPHFPTIQFNNKGLSSAIPFEEYRQQFHYDSILNNPKIANWSAEMPDQEKRIFHGDAMNKLLLTKVLKNDMTLKPEAVIILGIDERDIRRSYSSATAQNKIIVFNDEGTVLSDSEGQWIGRITSELPFFSAQKNRPGNGDAVIEKTKWISADLRSSITNWHVLVVQPRDGLLKQLNRIKWITTLMVCVTLLFGVFVSWSVAGVITLPIKRILTSMKKFQKGDFSQKVDMSGRDELGQLGGGYNNMVQRIKELIDDVYAFEIRQKQAELKVLQSQINPHFLYNTLNTIAWSAEKNGDRQVAEMIYSLSGIFKTSLSSGRETIRLQEEMDLAKHYLFLQKMRFPDKLSYEIKVQPELETFIVPKLLIQPLVENAVVHGIEPLAGDKGSIRVKASLSADSSRVEIEIDDNGLGMSRNKLAEISGRLQSDGDSASDNQDSFALVNIKNRIRLFYGPDASVHIQSAPGSGTKIVLHLPHARR